MQKKESHFLLNVFLLCIAVFLITSLTLGYDFSNSNPTNLGHSANEINVRLENKVYNLNSVIDDLNKTKIECGWSGWSGTGGTCQTSCVYGCSGYEFQIKCDTGILQTRNCCKTCASYSY